MTVPNNNSKNNNNNDDDDDYDNIIIHKIFSLAHNRGQRAHMTTVKHIYNIPIYIFI